MDTLNENDDIVNSTDNSEIITGEPVDDKKPKKKKVGDKKDPVNPSTDYIDVDKQEKEDNKIEYTDEELQQYKDTHGSYKNYNTEDFGEAMLIGNLSARQMSYSLGKDLKLSDEEHYWNNEVIKRDFIKYTGSEDLSEKKVKEKFSIYYKNLEGQYSKYKLDNYANEELIESLPAVSLGRGGSDPTKTYALSDLVSTFTRKDGGVKLNNSDTIYGATKTLRTADTQQIRLVSLDDEGKRSYTFIDATDENKEAILSYDSVYGFAYNAYSDPYGDSFMDVIINGKVWDDRLGAYVAVKEQQVVSSLDIFNQDNILGKLLKGNKKEIDSIVDVVALGVKSFINTFNNIWYTIPDLTRAAMGAVMGESATDTEFYNYLSKKHFKGARRKGSTTDYGMQHGFFGSWEVKLATVGDVAAQLMLASIIGRASNAGTNAALNSGLKAESMAGKALIKLNENSVMLALTGMASSSFYQEALDHGFTKRQAGLATIATTIAMWHANKLSHYTLEGMNPSIAKKAIDGVARQEINVMAAAIKPGATLAEETYTILGRTFNLSARFGQTLNTVKETFKKYPAAFAFLAEGSEEIFEDTSTEIVRQALNAVVAISGKDLHSIGVGEGRFKTYFDKNYVSDVIDNLMISGIAGGIGGPMGKVLHGSEPISTLTDDSSFLEVYQAGKGAELEAAIERRYKKGFVPEGILPVTDDATGAFMIGEGKSLNDYIYEHMKTKALMAKTFIETSGNINLDQLMENDPLLAKHADNSLLYRDAADIAVRLRELLTRNGLGTDVLQNIEDTDIQETLLKINEEQAVNREKLLQQAEQLKKELEDIKKLRGEITEENKQKELDDKEKELERKIADNKAEEIPEVVSQQDVAEIKELVRRSREITSGFATEMYVIQALSSAHKKFGARHVRDAEFQNFSDNFFFDTVRDNRNALNDERLERINVIKKSDENSERILSTKIDKIEDLTDIFNGMPYMSTEAKKHLENMLDELKESDEVMIPIIEYLVGDKFIDNLIALNIEDETNNKTFDTEGPHGVMVNDNGVSKELLDVMQTPEFKAALRNAFDDMLGVTRDADGKITSIENMLAVDSILMELPKATSAATNALISFDGTTKEFVAQYMGDMLAPLSPSMLGTLFKNSKSLLAKVELEFQKVATADTRYAKLQTFLGSVTDAVVDLELPNLNDDFNLSWMHKRLDINYDEGTVKTRNEDIITAIQTIEREYFKANTQDGTLEITMPENVKNELVNLKRELEIRQAQKEMFAMFSNIDFVEMLSKFRKNVKEEINADMFSKRRVFTQEESHIYKNATVLSDFINDFIFDPETTYDILKKSIDGKTLLVKEEEFLASVSEYVQRLSPMQRDEMYTTRSGLAVQLVYDIDSLEELDKGVENLNIFHSLEQAKEVADGMLYLFNKYGIDAKQATANIFLDARKARVMSNLETADPSGGFSHAGISKIRNWFAINEKELPKSIQAIDEFNAKYISGKVFINTEDEVIVAERLFLDFFREMGEIRDTMGNTAFLEVIAQGGSSLKAMYSLASIYNIDNFYSEYKKLLESKDSNGLIATVDQELNALLITNFLIGGSVAIKDGATPPTFMYIDGIAGSGKTHMVGGIALKVATALNENENRTTVLYAANNSHQIDNLKKGLTGVELTPQGYTQAELFDLLRRAKNEEKEALELVNSLFTIVFDEAGMLNSRKTASENSMQELKELIEAINAKRSGEDLKVILLGDDAQVGHIEETFSGEMSDIKEWMRDNNQYIGYNLRHNFRVSNTYMADAAALLRDFSAAKRSPKTVWGRQPQYGDRNMGMQIVMRGNSTANFTDLLSKELYDNIKAQLDSDPKFTVAFVPSEKVHIPGDSRMQQLVDEYGKERVSIISENNVQGLEWNYVITMWDPDTMGDGAVAIDTDLMYKKMYTLVSRAKDYALVLNANNINVTSTEIVGNVIMNETEADTSVAKEYVIKLLSDIEGKPTLTEEEQKKADLKKHMQDAENLLTSIHNAKASAVDKAKSIIQYSNNIRVIEERLQEKNVPEDEVKELKKMLDELVAVRNSLLGDYNNVVTSLQKSIDKYNAEFFDVENFGKIDAVSTKLISQNAANELKNENEITDDEVLNKLLEDFRKRQKEAEERDKEDRFEDIIGDEISVDEISVDRKTMTLVLFDIEPLLKESIGNKNDHIERYIFRTLTYYMITGDLNIDDLDTVKDYLNKENVYDFFLTHKKDFEDAIDMYINEYRTAKNFHKGMIAETVIEEYTKVDKTATDDDVERRERADMYELALTNAISEYVEREGLNKNIFDSYIEDAVQDSRGAFLMDTRKTITEDNNKKENIFSNQFTELSDDELFTEYTNMVSDYGKISKLNNFIKEIINKTTNGEQVTEKDAKEYIRIVDLLDELVLRKRLTAEARVIDDKTYDYLAAGQFLDSTDEASSSTTFATGISASAFYTMKQNQMNSEDGFNMQLHPVATKKEKDIARDIILKATKNNTVSFDTLDIQKVFKDKAAVSSLRFIGGMYDSTNPNGYLIATTNINGVDVQVVLGKFFLGIPKHMYAINQAIPGSMPENSEFINSVIKNKDILNKQLNLSPANKIVDSDKEPKNVKNLFRKLYPTTHRITALVESVGKKNAYVEKVFEGDIKNDMLDRMTQGSGKFTYNDNSLIEIQELEDRIIKQSQEEGKAKIQISSHTIVNAGSETFRGVPPGGTFRLYTSASTDLVDLNDMNTINVILNNQQYLVSDVKGNIVPVKIGIIPLRRHTTTYEAMYDELFPNNGKERSYEGQILTDKNASLNGTFTNIKVAKIVTALVEKLGSGKFSETVNMVNPAGLYAPKKSEWGKEVANDLLLVADRLGNEFNDIAVTVKGKDITGHGVTNEAFRRFIDRLDVDKMGVTLTSEDIMSSIFMPILRNFGTAVYKYSGRGTYLATHLSMLNRFDVKGETVTSFNTYTLISSIANELNERLKLAGILDADSRNAIVDNYMKELILPAMFELFADNNLFSEYANNNANITLLNGKVIENTVDFKVSTLRQRIGIQRATGNTQTNFIISRGLSSEKKALTGVMDITFGAITFNSEQFLENIYGQEDAHITDPDYNPITGEKYVNNQLDVNAKEALEKAKKDVTDTVQTIKNHDTTNETIPEAEEKVKNFKKALKDLEKSVENTTAEMVGSETNIKEFETHANEAIIDFNAEIRRLTADINEKYKAEEAGIQKVRDKITEVGTELDKNPTKTEEELTDLLQSVLDVKTGVENKITSVKGISNLSSIFTKFSDRIDLLVKGKSTVDAEKTLQEISSSIDNLKENNLSLSKLFIEKKINTLEDMGNRDKLTKQLNDKIKELTKDNSGTLTEKEKAVNFVKKYTSISDNTRAKFVELLTSNPELKQNIKDYEKGDDNALRPLYDKFLEKGFTEDEYIEILSDFFCK